MQELRANARAAAKRAVELDPELPQALAAMGSVKYQLDRDWIEGERYLRRSLELDPNQAAALETIGQLLITVGRSAEAITARMRGTELDPLSSFAARGLATAYYFARQYDAAIEVLERTIAADEKFLPAHKRLSQCFVQKGMLADAAAVEDVVKDHPQKGLVTNLGEGGFVYARAGRVAEARRNIELLFAAAKSRPLPALEIARVHVGLGEREEALRWLEKAVERRDENQNLVFLRVEPMWDSLRSDPRFEDVIRRTGIPPLVTGG